MSTERTTIGQALRAAAEQFLVAADAADRDQLPELLTPKQAAELLKVSDYTIRRWIHAGELEASKVGEVYRIPVEAIREKLA